MEGRHIRVFLALIEARTLSSAAQRLNLTESSVSRTIKDLEQVLRVSLFERTPRGMSPTIFGKSFERHARAIRAELNRAVDDLIELGGRSDGTVSVGTTPSFATELLPRACERIFKKNPHANIKVHDGLLDFILSKLVSGELDLAISTLIPRRMQDPALSYEVFGLRDCVTLLVRADHPLAKCTDLAIEDLQDQDWILPKKPDFFREILDERFIERDLQPPRPRIEVESFATLKDLILGGNYISFLPAMIARREISAGVMNVLNVDECTFERSGCVISYKHKSPSIIASNLKREILSLGSDPRIMINKAHLRDLQATASPVR
jgi:DNA-binding transcriptional LysR family regulator